MKIKSLMCVSALTVMPAVTNGELYLYESFDYNEGALTEAPLWADFGNQGSIPVMVGEGSLTYEGLPDPKGNHAIVNEEAGRRVSHPVIPGIESGRAYYSVVVNLTKLPSERTYAMHFTGSRYSGRLFFLDAGNGKYRVGVANGTGAEYAETELEPGEDQLFVVRYTFDANSDQDEVALFINPDASGGEPESPDVVHLDRPETLINEFVFRQWDGVGSYLADELRIGTSWDAVMRREKLSPQVAEERARYLKWQAPLSAHRLKYNNPGLVDFAGVGLWALPLAMDWDGDGDNDLIISNRAKPHSGTYFLENIGSDVLLAPKEIAGPKTNLTISHTEDGPVILEPGKMYRDFSKGIFGTPEEIPFNQEFYSGRVNQWELVDWEGDGDHDLMIGVSDWRDYGWDDAYNEKGEWTAGPLHGYVYLVINEGDDENPNYGEPNKINAGSGPIDTYGAPSPNYVDWDGDGDLDIMAGEFLDRITFFENVGSRENPEFAKGEFLEYNGETIHLELEMLMVDAMDWDQDGDPDLIVGKEDGRVVFIENVGDGTVKEPRYFQQRADEVKFGALTTPNAVDWDGDGDKDLIVGNTAGFIAFIENLDGGNPPQFALPQLLEADGEVLRIMAGENLSIQGPAEAKWGYTAPTVADWNNDGLPDIITNSIIGRIVWYKNVGTRQEPKLAGPLAINLNYDGENPKPAWYWWQPEGDDLVTQWRTTPVTIDLNQDGKVDLVLQDPEGFLAYYERTGDPVDSSRVDQGERIFRMSDDESVYSHVGEIDFFDFNEDGENDVFQRSANGGLVYITRNPMTREMVTVTEEGIVEAGVELKDAPNGEKTLLRMSAGWAGRSGRRKFTLVDWDMDGDLDLLVNSRGINFLENMASGSGFEFVDRGRITPHVLAGHTTWPTTVDWNEDGIPDLLVGAEDGNFYYYERSSSNELTKGF